MPPVSQNQRKAMYAAAAGHSTLGIPVSVGKEFVGADKGGKLPKRINRTAQTSNTSLPKKMPKHGAGHLMSFGSLAPGVEDGE